MAMDRTIITLFRCIMSETATETIKLERKLTSESRESMTSGVAGSRSKMPEKEPHLYLSSELKAALRVKGYSKNQIVNTIANMSIYDLRTLDIDTFASLVKTEVPPPEKLQRTKSKLGSKPPIAPASTPQPTSLTKTLSGSASPPDTPNRSDLPPKSVHAMTSPDLMQSPPLAAPQVNPRRKIELQLRSRRTNRDSTVPVFQYSTNSCKSVVIAAQSSYPAVKELIIKQFQIPDNLVDDIRINYMDVQDWCYHIVTAKPLKQARTEFNSSMDSLESARTWISSIEPEFPPSVLLHHLQDKEMEHILYKDLGINCVVAQSAALCIFEKNDVVRPRTKLPYLQEFFKEPKVSSSPKGKLAIHDKIAKLQERYCGYRVMRGDGNCYYRAVIFGLLEQIVSEGKFYKLMDLYETFLTVNYKDKELNTSHRRLLDLLLLASDGHLWSTLGHFESEYLKAETDAACVRACRRLVSNYIQQHSDEDVNGISLTDALQANYPQYKKNLKLYCEECIEKMGVDAEGPHVYLSLLPKVLHSDCTIALLDRREEIELSYLDNKIDETTQASGGPKGRLTEITGDIHLLYRPGHYDLIYPSSHPPFPLRQCVIPPIQRSSTPSDRLSRRSGGSADVSPRSIGGSGGKFNFDIVYENQGTPKNASDTKWFDFPDQEEDTAGGGELSYSDKSSDDLKLTISVDSCPSPSLSLSTPGLGSHTPNDHASDSPFDLLRRPHNSVNALSSCHSAISKGRKAGSAGSGSALRRPSNLFSENSMYESPPPLSSTATTPKVNIYSGNDLDFLTQFDTIAVSPGNEKKATEESKMESSSLEETPVILSQPPVKRKMNSASPSSTHDGGSVPTSPAATASTAAAKSPSPEQIRKPPMPSPVSSAAVRDPTPIAAADGGGGCCVVQ